MNPLWLALIVVVGFLCDACLAVSFRGGKLGRRDDHRDGNSEDQRRMFMSQETPTLPTRDTALQLQSSSSDEDWYNSLPPQLQLDLVRAAVATSWNESAGDAVGSVASSDEYCLRPPQVRSDALPRGSASIRAMRRVRVRWYLLPSNPIHVCSGPGILVQTMQRNAKYVCRSQDVYTTGVRRRITTEVMPALSDWLSHTLLVPEAEVHLDGSAAPAGSRRRKLSIDRDLGVCEGQLGAYIPASHRASTTSRGQGLDNPRHLFDIPASSDDGQPSLTAFNGVVFNTTPVVTSGNSSSFSDARGSYRSSRTEEGVDVDLVIYVTTMFSYYYLDAMPCQVHPLTGRPTVIHLNIDPGLLHLSVAPSGSSSGMISQLYARYILHDLLQALSLKNFYVDLDPTQFTDPNEVNPVVGSRRQLNVTEVLMSYSRPEQLTSQSLIRDPVRALTAAHFNCPSMVGADLENFMDFMYTIQNNVLSGRLFSFELFTADELDLLLSDRTYGVVQSSGWWTIDWELPLREPNPFGLLAGCSFVQKLCNESDFLVLPQSPTGNAVWNSTRNNSRVSVFVPSPTSQWFGTSAQPNETAVAAWVAGSWLSNDSLIQSSFCFEDSSSYHCHVEHQGIAVCGTTTYPYVLPTLMQYFPLTPSLGGNVERAYFCPMLDTGYKNCGTLLASVLGISASVFSMYNDVFCFDAISTVVVDLEWVSAPFRNLETMSWFVAKKNGTGCFRVTECDAASRTYSVRRGVANVGVNGTNNTVQWPLVTVCTGDGEIETFETFGFNESITINRTYVCISYEAVCGSVFQDASNLFPRTVSMNDVTQRAITDPFTVPSLAWRTFADLDVRISLAAVSAFASPWSAANLSQAATQTCTNALHAPWYSTCATSTADRGYEPTIVSTVTVPISVAFSLPRAGMAPFGGVIVVAMSPSSPLRCQADDFLLPSNASVAAGFLQRRNASAHVPDVLAFAVGLNGSSLAPLTTYVTSTVMCEFVLPQNGSVDVDGDPGYYDEISLFSLLPMSVVINATTGWYESRDLPNVTTLTDALQRNDMGKVLFAEVRRSSCTNTTKSPSRVNATKSSSSPPVFGLVRVASSFNVNPVSDDLSPWLPLNSLTSFAPRKMSNPSTGGMCVNGSTEGDLGSWWAPDQCRAIGLTHLLVSSLSPTNSNQSLVDDDVLRWASSDSGMGAPNATIRLSASSSIPLWSSMMVSISWTAATLPNTTIQSAFVLNYNGPVTPVAAVVPSPQLLDRLQAVNQTCASRLAPSVNLISAQVLRDSFATADPSDSTQDLYFLSGTCYRVLDNMSLNPISPSSVRVSLTAMENLHSFVAAACSSATNSSVGGIAATVPSFILRVGSGIQCRSFSLDLPGFSYKTVGQGPQPAASAAVSPATVDMLLVNETQPGSLNVTSSGVSSLPSVALRTTMGNKQPLYLNQTIDAVASNLAVVLTNPTCTRCRTDVYAEFTLPPSSQGVFGDDDKVVLRLDDTQYRRDQMLNHPLWNMSVVVLGCSSPIDATVDMWRGQQLVIRVARSNRSTQCRPWQRKIGLFVPGFYTVSSSPTPAPPIAEFCLAQQRITVVYQKSPATISLLGSCPGCNGRGICNADGSCSCFVGYGGKQCTMCSTWNMSTTSGGCVTACDGTGPQQPPSGAVPSAAFAFVSTCIHMGGWLNPQRGCRCYCNGTLCSEATQTVSLTVTQPVRVTTNSPSGGGTTTPTASAAPLTQSSTPSSHTPQTTATTMIPFVSTTTTPTSGSSASPTSVVIISTTVSPTSSNTPTVPSTLLPTPTSTYTSAPSSSTFPGGATSSNTPFPSNTETLSPASTTSPSGTVAPSSSPAPSSAQPRTTTPVLPENVTQAITLTISPSKLLTETVSITDSLTAIMQSQTVSVSRSPTHSNTAVVYPPLPPLRSDGIVFLNADSSFPRTAIDSSVRGGDPFRLIVSCSFTLQRAFFESNAVTTEAFRLLLTSAGSPFQAATKIVVPFGAVVEVSLGGMWTLPIFSTVIIPLFHIAPPECNHEPPFGAAAELVNKTSLWNGTVFLGNLSTNTSLIHVALNDTYFLTDLFVYGPLVRECFPKWPLNNREAVPPFIVDDRNQMAYVYLTPSSADDTSLLQSVSVIRKVHAAVWGFLFFVFLLTSPHLVLDVQLIAFLGATSALSPNACRGPSTMEGPTMFSSLLRPSNTQWVLTPATLVPNVDSISKSSTMLLDGLVFHEIPPTLIMIGIGGWLIKICVMEKQCSALSFALFWSKSRPARLLIAVIVLLVPGLVWVTTNALMGIEFVSTQSNEYNWKEISAMALLPLSVGFICLGFAVFTQLARCIAVKPRGVLYTPLLATLSRARRDASEPRRAAPRSKIAWIMQLEQAPPRSLFWSRRLAVWIATWFPPTWALPHGYWSFSSVVDTHPLRWYCEHLQQSEQGVSPFCCLFARWVLPLQLLRNIVVAVLFGLSGSAPFCLVVDPSWNATFPSVNDSRDDVEPIVPYAYALFVSVGLVVALQALVFGMSPFVSRAHAAASLVVTLSFAITSITMFVDGSLPQGGMFSSTMLDPVIPTASRPCVIVLLLVDALSLLCGLYFVLEHSVLTSYIKEVDRTLRAHFEHCNALEDPLLDQFLEPMLPIQSPTSLRSRRRDTDDDMDDEIEFSEVRLTESSTTSTDSDDRNDDNPLETLRGMIATSQRDAEAAKPKMKKSKGKGKAKEKPTVASMADSDVGMSSKTALNRAGVDDDDDFADLDRIFGHTSPSRQSAAPPSGVASPKIKAEVRSVWNR